MELEQRIALLEKQVQDLKTDIQSVLFDIRDNLPAMNAAAPRWQKKAWSLSLLNLVIAAALFSNLPTFAPNLLPHPWSSWLHDWVYPFWVSLAFVWLLLQMYPLALLLQQEDVKWNGLAGRNLVSFLRSQPYLVLLLTALVLVAALVKDVLPLAWMFIALALIVAMASQGLHYLSDLLRARR